MTYTSKIQFNSPSNKKYPVSYEDFRSQLRNQKAPNGKHKTYRVDQPLSTHTNTVV